MSAVPPPASPDTSTVAPDAERDAVAQHVDLAAGLPGRLARRIERPAHLGAAARGHEHDLAVDVGDARRLDDAARVDDVVEHRFGRRSRQQHRAAVRRDRAGVADEGAVRLADRRRDGEAQQLVAREIDGIGLGAAGQHDAAERGLDHAVVRHLLAGKDRIAIGCRDRAAVHHRRARVAGDAERVAAAVVRADRDRRQQHRGGVDVRARRHRDPGRIDEPELNRAGDQAARREIGDRAARHLVDEQRTRDRRIDREREVLPAARTRCR